MTTILNLTPHAIFIDDGCRRTTIEASGQIARLVSQPQDECVLTLSNGLNVADAPRFSSVSLPDVPATTEAIIVSMPVGQYLAESHFVISTGSLPGRTVHVLGPDTGPGQALRDEHGQIFGTRRLVRYVTLP